MGICGQEKNTIKKRENPDINNQEQILSKCDDKINNCNLILDDLNIKMNNLQEEAKSALRAGNKYEAKRILRKKKSLLDYSNKIKQLIDKIEEEKILLNQTKYMNPLTNLINRTNKQLNENIQEIKNEDFGFE